MAATTPVWSADGKYLAILANNASAFGNDGSSFVDGTPSINDLLLYQLDSGQLLLVSHNATVGNQASALVAAVSGAQFTADGKYLVFNTTEGAQSLLDSASIRRASLAQGIPYYTTISGARAATQAIRVLKTRPLEAGALQTYS